MPPRIFFDSPLQHGLDAAAPVPLPSGAARHVQVLRLQPGAALTLFDGLGGEWAATVTRMGRSDVDVQVQSHDPVERELSVRVTLAMGMPANERMDTLIEKATELGADGFVPLVCERSVLRLSGERAERKVDHWQGVARAACEQSGRTRLPVVQPVQSLGQWLKNLPGADERSTSIRWILSLRGAEPLQARLASAVAGLREPGASLLVLSGPEGGFTEGEEAAAREKGFVPVSLGPRVLRADTAPMSVMAHIGYELMTST